MTLGWAFHCVRNSMKRDFLAASTAGTALTISARRVESSWLYFSKSWLPRSVSGISGSDLGAAAHVVYASSRLAVSRADVFMSAFVA